MQAAFPVCLGALSFWMVFVLVLLAHSKFWTKMQVTSLICRATPCLAIPLAIRGFTPHCLQLGVVRLLLLIVVRAWMPSFSQKSYVHVDTSKYSWPTLRSNFPWKSDLKFDPRPSLLWDVVCSCQPTQRNIPEERRFQLYRGGSLKSRISLLSPFVFDLRTLVKYYLLWGVILKLHMPVLCEGIKELWGITSFFLCW